jgi:hypothetical protein
MNVGIANGGSCTVSFLGIHKTDFRYSVGGKGAMSALYACK